MSKTYVDALFELMEAVFGEGNVEFVERHVISPRLFTATVSPFVKFPNIETIKSLIEALEKK